MGIGTELEMLAPSSDEHALNDVHWTVVLAGRGALYAHCQESVAKEVSDVMAGVTKTGKSWAGTLDSQATVGPDEGRCVVASGTGEFADKKGHMVEIDGYRTISPTDVTAEVRLVFTLGGKP